MKKIKSIVTEYELLINKFSCFSLFVHINNKEKKYNSEIENLLIQIVIKITNGTIFTNNTINYKTSRSIFKWLL